MHVIITGNIWVSAVRSVKMIIIRNINAHNNDWWTRRQRGGALQRNCPSSGRAAVWAGLLSVLVDTLLEWSYSTRTWTSMKLTNFSGRWRFCMTLWSVTTPQSDAVSTHQPREYALLIHLVLKIYCHYFRRDKFWCGLAQIFNGRDEIMRVRFFWDTV